MKLWPMTRFDISDVVWHPVVTLIRYSMVTRQGVSHMGVDCPRTSLQLYGLTIIVWGTKIVWVEYYVMAALIFTRNATRFRESLAAILDDVIWSESLESRTWYPYERPRSSQYTCGFVVITVSADGLAPLGARASAGNVMTNVGFRIDRHFNTLRPRQNGRHSPDGILKRIFLN